jgi:hypothetical protein
MSKRNVKKCQYLGNSANECIQRAYACRALAADGDRRAPMSRNGYRSRKERCSTGGYDGGIVLDSFGGALCRRRDEEGEAKAMRSKDELEAMMRPA